MSDYTSNHSTRLSNTDNVDEGISNLTGQISKLNAAEDRIRDITNHISSLINEIREPKSHNINEKQKVSAKQKKSEKQKVNEEQIELTASIITLNNTREQSRYGYSVLWKQWGDVQGEDGNEVAGQVRNLNRTHERNRQGIAALWREVRDLHREEEKLVGEKGLVGCKAGKGGTSGVAWGHVLRVFSGMDSDM